MSYLPEFLTVIVVHLLAVMSPGPDFAIVTKNSLIYSRRSAIYTALGVGLGISIHVIYSLVGIGLIVSKSIILFSTIKFLGAAYLIYIGYKSFRSKKPSVAGGNPPLPEGRRGGVGATSQSSELSPTQAIRIGFLTNALNPKATLFFLSLFTQVISTSTPLYIQTLYGIEMIMMTFTWFAGVAIVLSQARIKQKFSSIQYYLEKTFGAILIALGIKVALSKR